MMIKIGRNEKKIIIIKESGNWKIDLLEEGAEALVIGIIVGKKGDNIKINTIQNHLSSNTKSFLLIKSALFDDSKFTYNGLIRIEKNTEKVEAYQRNNNLLLGPKNKVESKPNLEILANDVICTHGVTIGKIDRELMFYLLSRGIKEEEAKKILINGFFEEAIKYIKDNKYGKFY